PYHHFKDKCELLDAVAKEGWHELGQAIAKARAAAADARSALTEIGVAYVAFARKNPALYRLMYQAAGNRERMPDESKDADSGGRAHQPGCCTAATLFRRSPPMRRQKRPRADFCCASRTSTPSAADPPSRRRSFGTCTGLAWNGRRRCAGSRIERRPTARRWS